MAKRTHIVMGDERYYKALQKLAQKKSGWWSCDAKTADGELLLFYFIRPYSAIIATATASSDARPDKVWRFVANVKNVRIIDHPVTLAEIREKIPEWGWAIQPRRAICVPENIVGKLQKLVNLTRKESSEGIISSSGAGFGTPEQNRIVEKAACKAVRLHFKNEGFKVNSREKENLGYDFDAKRDREELHIEVKGISGVVTEFIITAGEVKCARTDSRFRVAAVTEATKPRRKIKIFTGTEFLKKFTLRPLAYSVEMKRNLLA